MKDKVYTYKFILSAAYMNMKNTILSVISIIIIENFIGIFIWLDDYVDCYLDDYVEVSYRVLVSKTKS